jgi:hypothetical protein
VSCLLCCLHSHTSARRAFQRSQSDSQVSRASERVSEWRYRRSTRIFLSCPRLKMESRELESRATSTRHTPRSLSDPSAEIKTSQWVDIIPFKRILLSVGSFYLNRFSLLVCGISTKDAYKSTQKYFKLSC